MKKLFMLVLCGAAMAFGLFAEETPATKTVDGVTYTMKRHLGLNDYVIVDVKGGLVTRGTNIFEEVEDEYGEPIPGNDYYGINLSYLVNSTLPGATGPVPAAIEIFDQGLRYIRKNGTDDYWGLWLGNKGYWMADYFVAWDVSGNQDASYPFLVLPRDNGTATDAPKTMTVKGKNCEILATRNYCVSKAKMSAFIDALATAFGKTLTAEQKTSLLNTLE